jgi:hypothetical protein
MAPMLSSNILQQIVGASTFVVILAFSASLANEIKGKISLVAIDN